MTSIYASLLVFCMVAYGRAADGKKNNQRDVNDAETQVDYAFSKIPVYVIPNTPPAGDGKVPVALIPGAYPSPYLNAGGKEAKHKYAFYAPYKIPKVTPIHEPTTEESPVTYGTQYVYQKPEYDSAYKVPLSAKDYQASTAYLKYYENPAKTLLPKHQAITNSNAYASLAPAYAYLNSEQQSPNSLPAPKKYTTYDPENNVQIQYVIKYVPVPYTVSAHEQYPQNTPDLAYITPKPYYYNSAAKKTQTPDVQAAHTANSLAYQHSTDGYGEYAKYAESYAPLFDDASAPLPSFKYIQPSASPYKYYGDKAAKKYVPTSYVLASIGKTLPTHYSTSIKHENGNQENSYSTKLVPIPLPVDKYTAQDFKPSPVEDAKSYSEPDYAYTVSNTKYKQSLIPAVPHLLSYDYGIPYQHRPSFYKKDVSNSVSSTSNYETNSEKHN